MQRVFKTKAFKRWSRKAGISDGALCAAVAEMMRGLVDADLGGRVFKKRIPVAGRGKRGGARTIVGSNLQDRWFFVYGFEKKDRETLDPRELAAVQTVAAALLAMDPKLLEKAVAESELEEICREEKSPAG